MCEQIARDYCKRAHSTAQCCIESAEAKGTGREQGVSSRYDCRISCSQSLFLATSFQQLLPSLLKRSTSRGNFWLASKKLDAQFCNVNKLHTQRAHKHAQTKSRHREKASIIDLVFWPKLFCLALHATMPRTRPSLPTIFKLACCDGNGARITRSCFEWRVRFRHERTANNGGLAYDLERGASLCWGRDAGLEEQHEQ